MALADLDWGTEHVCSAPVFRRRSARLRQAQRPPRFLDSGRVLSEGWNKLGRLVVELAVLVSFLGGHPWAETKIIPRPNFSIRYDTSTFCGIRCP
jgi:hypothetical protein